MMRLRRPSRRFDREEEANGAERRAEHQAVGRARVGYRWMSRRHLRGDGASLVAGALHNRGCAGLNPAGDTEGEG